ncbi:MAG TPA: MASE1 domain-containing protein [Gemmatimonadales bacterium]|nr:MASE1 domain-containing protein [Gemmatimonadales bacterium]
MTIQNERIREGATYVALTALYFVAGQVGIWLAFGHPDAITIWPSAGLALAAFLLLGNRVWPAIYAGAFLVSIVHGRGFVSSLFIATGNTWEGLIGAFLLQRFANGPQAFDRARDVLRFTFHVALGSTLIGAAFTATTLSLSGAARWADYYDVWLAAWLSDACGVFLVAPLILLWAGATGVRWDTRRVIEGAVLAAFSVLAALVVFGRLFPVYEVDYPLSFLPMPVFIWAAFRFDRRGAAMSVALVYLVAVFGTLRGYGPFAHFPRNHSLVYLQVFTCVSSVTALMLAAVVRERRQVEDQLRVLAVSDPLTGLANYGHLVDVLEGEVQRSLRTERQFAVLFMDMDGLKKVNDRYGHLIGSRALVRIAEVLRSACRSIDTAARYGGDEFALVLPESDEAAGQLVAGRVAEMLAADTRHPPVSVSTGIATYPKDGSTAEALVAAADRMLYAAKHRSRHPEGSLSG